MNIREKRIDNSQMQMSDSESRSNEDKNIFTVMYCPLIYQQMIFEQKKNVF